MSDLTFLDGGMGTLLQARGLRPGECPEDWNVERPDDVAAIHRAYVEAGAEVIYANTFGANPLKYHGKFTVEKVVRAALANARKAIADAQDTRRKTKDVKIALDIGPTGHLLKPVGDLDFDEAVAAFSETIRAAVGSDRVTVESDSAPVGSKVALSDSNLNGVRPDLIVIETMGDIGELKAAVVAAKETCDLPVYATVTLDASGKLLTGGSVACVAALLESLGVDAYGFNCGLGPREMLPHVERLAKLTSRPIIAKPNAGLPTVVDGKTVFTVDPATFAEDVGKLVAAGASIVGGCCGTTPEHVRAVAARVRTNGATTDRRQPTNGATTDGRQPTTGATTDGAPPVCRLSPVGCPTQGAFATVVSSSTSVVTLRPSAGLVIGERINPTGKKALKEAYRTGDVAYVLREAVKQVEAGAAVLDVNCGVPGLDERALLDATVRSVQSVVTVPLQIDTADPQALEGALRHVAGKPLVNSVNGKRESMDAVFPLVRKYGGAIVALCLDENGIPATSDGRLAIARRILAEGEKYGFTKADFVFDALTLAVSADPQAAVVTLETVRRLTEELGVNTVLGVSNVSFGLPNRPALNNAMYALAKRAGLSAAIANPAAIKDEIDPAAEDVLLGRDPNCARWIARQAREASQARSASEASSASQARSASPASATSGLSVAIRAGLRDDARDAAAAALAGGQAPLDVIQSGIVPALEEIGRGFEKGTVFLPQLLMAADAAGEAFAVVKATMAASRSSDSNPARAPIILATVKGDIHDIGKNIVRALLENYGFDVIDLGRDVPPEKVVETARESNAMLVGLSALMTTTIGAMAETIRQLKAAGLACKTCVGGAVVTQEFADEIGADYYAKDAMRTVRVAEALKDLSEGKKAT